MNDLPEELCKLLEDHIDSVAQLEALLLLLNSPDVVWNPQTAAKRLYIAEYEANSVLAHLTAHNLIRQDPEGYRYQPNSEELEKAISLLAVQYRTHLIQITKLIHSKPRAIQSFADAFKLKKD